MEVSSPKSPFRAAFEDYSRCAPPTEEHREAILSVFSAQVLTEGSDPLQRYPELLRQLEGARAVYDLKPCEFWDLRELLHLQREIYLSQMLQSGRADNLEVHDRELAYLQHQFREDNRVDISCMHLERDTRDQCAQCLLDSGSRQRCTRVCRARQSQPVQESSEELLQA
ncbi:hypothetical protein COU80_01335 [Candidatus Peregrinibacteria bacterium CG10_big_fil_rev_8_21_14_0_10_55_24]|nr:MAG: hypothetical protein COU80_01335 [Candidatus Peregrinibacteria bacterium CG10_big_fil_rev_8_21_14_0_10_55_24]